jgi:CRISPR-associated protein Csx3
MGVALAVLVKEVLMEHYSVFIETEACVTMIRVGFGKPATNSVLVAEVDEHMRTTAISCGKLCLVNGPASLPVAFILAHHLFHKYEEVAIFDPKLAAYVVVSSHGGSHSVGDTITAGVDGYPV